MKYFVLFLFLWNTNADLSIEYQKEYSAYQESIFITNDRYQNNDVIWGRPKCLECGNIPGASPTQFANLFPDKFTIYFVANIHIKLGWKLEIKGQYPHSRYFSFTVAKQLGNGQVGNGDYLNGLTIEPDQDSYNPFIPKNGTNTTNRDYTLYVVGGQKPLNPPPNTLYTGLGDKSNRTHLAIRVYLHDQGYDGSGVSKLNEDKSGLPIVRLILHNGTILSGPDLLDILKAEKNGDPNGYQKKQWFNEINNSNDKVNAPCLKESYGEIFWNTDYSITGSFIAKEPEKRVRLYPPNDDGGFASNPDTRYIIFAVSLNYGEVFVISGLKPTHPKTYHNRETISSDVDLQYFSVTTCAGPVSGECWDTVFDENIPVDSNGYYTIVISWPWNWPANAVRNNKVVWLSPGNGEGHYVGARLWVLSVFIRYQGLNPNWEYSPAKIPMPSEKNPLPMDPLVMGPFYPIGKYMSKEEFEMNY